MNYEIAIIRYGSISGAGRRLCELVEKLNMALREGLLLTVQRIILT
jgi:hypothetical protein